MTDELVKKTEAIALTLAQQCAALHASIQSREDEIADDKRQLKEMRKQLLEAWNITGCPSQQQMVGRQRYSVFKQKIFRASVNDDSMPHFLKWLRAYDETVDEEDRVFDKMVRPQVTGLNEFVKTLEMNGKKTPIGVSVFKDTEIRIRKS